MHKHAGIKYGYQAVHSCLSVSHKWQQYTTKETTTSLLHNTNTPQLASLLAAVWFRSVLCCSRTWPPGKIVMVTQFVESCRKQECGWEMFFVVGEPGPLGRGVAVVKFVQNCRKQECGSEVFFFVVEPGPLGRGVAVVKFVQSCRKQECGSEVFFVVVELGPLGRGVAVVKFVQFVVVELGPLGRGVAVVKFVQSCRKQECGSEVFFVVAEFGPLGRGVAVVKFVQSCRKLECGSEVFFVVVELGSLGRGVAVAQFVESCWESSWPAEKHPNFLPETRQANQIVKTTVSNWCCLIGQTVAQSKNAHSQKPSLAELSMSPHGWVTVPCFTPTARFLQTQNSVQTLQKAFSKTIICIEICKKITYAC